MSSASLGHGFDGINVAHLSRTVVTRSIRSMQGEVLHCHRWWLDSTYELGTGVRGAADFIFNDIRTAGLESPTVRRLLDRFEMQDELATT